MFGRSNLQIIQRAFQFHCCIDGNQLTTQECALLILNKFFLQFFLFYLIDAFIKFFDRTILLDKFCCRFRTHPFYSGDMVTGITHQPHHLNHFFRRYPKLFFNFIYTNPFILHGIQHLNFGAYQLHHIFITTDNNNPKTCLGAF